MEYFYRRKPFNEEGKPIRGYRKRIFRNWRETGMFESTEQRVCNQTRAIKKNGWLSEFDLEAIKRQEEDESQGELCREHDVNMEAETVQIDAETVEEEINFEEDSFGDAEGDMSD